MPPCGCGKSKRQGVTPASLAKQQAEQASRPPGKPNAAGAMTPSNAPVGTTQSFRLILRDGSDLTFGSRLEADAENVRRGYTGTVRPV